MSKILEKFDTCFDKLLGKFEMKLVYYLLPGSILNKYYADLHDANVRLDKLEHSLADIDQSYATSAPPDTPPPNESR